MEKDPTVIYNLGGGFKCRYQKDGVLIIYNENDSKEAFYLSKESQRTLRHALNG